MFVLTEREKGAHLLRRFGLGASESELDYYMKDGLKGAVEKLLNCENVTEPFAAEPKMFENDKGQIQMQVIGAWYTTKLLTTRRPLLEKMALFWHNHFATSADKVTGPYLMAAQNETLRSLSLGKFQDLLTGVSKDPAMLIWLDGADNIKGKANENFAREIMELFTLGEGQYTEKDIQEAARAFTGWSYVGGGRQQNLRRANLQYLFKPALHDSGTKTIFGKTGNFKGEDVIAMLCAMPRTAEFLTRKIWEWFVYPNPSQATIKPFSDRFFKSGLEIKSLLRDIMTSEEFYSVRAYRQLIKNPVDFCVVTLRSMGVGENVSKQFESLTAETSEIAKKAILARGIQTWQAMKSQGMWLLYPPDVSGWKPGDGWITSATMVERINWAAKMFGGARQVARFPLYGVIANDPKPIEIAKKLCSIYDVQLSDQKMWALANAAEKAMGPEGLTERNSGEVVLSVTRLIFGSPEFQLA